MKIYVASSWHNIYQQQLVELLKKSHYEVYDFQHPNIKQNGFNWTSIDKNWKEWDFSQYKNALTHPYAEEGFNNDFCCLVGNLLIPKQDSWPDKARKS